MGQFGRGTSSHALQPLRLRAGKGLLWGHLTGPLGSPLSPIQPFPQSPACTQGSPCILLPYFHVPATCLPVCIPLTSSGTSPASSLFFQAPI